jgi:tellurite resistance protein
VIAALALEESGLAANPAFLDMSEGFDRQKMLVKRATGIIAASEGTVKISQGMKLAGFTTPEQQNMKLYQQVRRGSSKVAVFNIPKQKKGVAAAVMEVNILHATLSDISSLTSKSGNIEVIISSPEVIDIDEEDATTLGNNNNTTTTGSTKKTRSTSKEVQRRHALKAKTSLKDKVAMKQATVLIHRNKLLPKGHPKKKSIEAIVKGVNKRLDSNVSAKTAAQYYVRDGIIGKSPKRRGPPGAFPHRVWKALKGAFTTYLKLELGASYFKEAVNHQGTISKLVNGGVNKAGFAKTRDDLTRKLKKETAHHFEVGKANVVDERKED